MTERTKTVLSHLAFVVVFLALWEFVMRRQWLPETFFGTPTGIANYLWVGFVTGGKLWLELGYTVAGTLISFVLGSVAALALGLVFVMFPKVERAMEPYLSVLNAMPRFALAPLFLGAESSTACRSAPKPRTCSIAALLRRTSQL